MWKHAIEQKFANPIQPASYWTGEINRSPIKNFGITGYALPVSSEGAFGLEMCAKSALLMMEHMFGPDGKK